MSGTLPPPESEGNIPPPSDENSGTAKSGASKTADRGQGKPWTKEDLQNLLNAVGPIGKYLVDAWKWKTEQDAIQGEKWDKRALETLVLLMGFLGGLIILMSLLTIWGKVSGDALLFLVGAVASWILFAAQRYLFGGDEQETKPLL
jgi:hypothetical protein